MGEIPKSHALCGYDLLSQAVPFSESHRVLLIHIFFSLTFFSWTPTVAVFKHQGFPNVIS